MFPIKTWPFSRSMAYCTGFSPCFFPYKTRFCLGGSWNRSTPSHHPFLHGIFHEITHVWGSPPFKWNLPFYPGWPPWSPPISKAFIGTGLVWSPPRTIARWDSGCVRPLRAAARVPWRTTVFGFPSRGGPQKRWMVCKGKCHLEMDDDRGYPPILGNLHVKWSFHGENACFDWWWNSNCCGLLEGIWIQGTF